MELGVPDALQRPSRCCAEPGPMFPRTVHQNGPRLCSAPRREERRAALRPGTEMTQCRIAGTGVAATIVKGRAMNDAAIRGEAQMARWIRFEQGGNTGFGTLEGDTI